jgi:hypothetical protein
MNTDELKNVLEQHLKWINNDGGNCANLSGANLSGVNLSGANLRGVYLSDANLRGVYLSDANLSGVNLSGANLSGVNLSDANLRGANLRGVYLSDANLSGANLSGVNLSGANLRGANLSGANLRGANLSGAYLSDAKIDQTLADKLNIIPDGDIIGWKKCMKGVIVKMEIGANTPRSNATGRKCRAESVEVLEVIGADAGISQYDTSVVYRVGETVSVENFDTDRWHECSAGIHFFLTREEAENY